MQAEPKRRGRPPRLVPAHVQVTAPDPPRYRLKACISGPPMLQEAVRHPDGIAWRTVPIVPVTASDWEEG